MVQELRTLRYSGIFPRFREIGQEFAEYVQRLGGCRVAGFEASLVDLQRSDL
jgi:hypothetical protein